MGKTWRRWHEKDPWRKRAQAEGYRSRATYKLKAIQDRFHVFRRGDVVVDLGACPGGWSQVAAECVGTEGRVIAVDLKRIEAMPGVESVRGDATDADVQKEIVAIAGPADVLLSDMSPRISGAYSIDHARQVALAESALDTANALLKPGGVFVTKVFQGDLFKAFYDTVGTRFARVQGYRPPATRARSSETFIVGRGFRGPRGP